MRIGYARVSTRDQSFDLQEDALRQAGCEKIYKEVASGSKTERVQLLRLLDEIRTGDVLVVWKLDRLGRSLSHLIRVITDCTERGISIQSLNDPIDTTTTQGRLVFNMFASLAEFERDLIRERTQAGLNAARQRGRKGGRPKGLTREAEATAAAAETLYKEGTLSVSKIAQQLSISRGTLYNYLRHRGVEISPHIRQAATR